MGQCFGPMTVHCTVTEKSSVYLMGDGHHSWVMSKLITTIRVDAQQDLMGQCLDPVTEHHTVTKKSGVNLMRNWCQSQVTSELSTTTTGVDTPQDLMGQCLDPTTVHCTVRGESNTNHIRRNVHCMMVHKSDTTNENIVQPFPPYMAQSHHCVNAQCTSPNDGQTSLDRQNLDQLHTHLTAVHMILLH